MEAIDHYEVVNSFCEELWEQIFKRTGDIKEAKRLLKLGKVSQSLVDYIAADIKRLDNEYQTTRDAQHAMKIQVRK